MLHSGITNILFSKDFQILKPVAPKHMFCPHLYKIPFIVSLKAKTKYLEPSCAIPLTSLLMPSSWGPPWFSLHP